MSYILHFLPEVEDDAAAGYRWYEEKASGLGDEFLRMFYACAGNIARNPLIYSKAHGQFRRSLLRRFPYAVYYKLEGNNILVFGLFDGARAPQSIRKDIEKRNDKEIL